MTKRECPFCSCEKTDLKRQQSHGERFWVQCVLCGARGPPRNDGVEAIIGWNEREPARTKAAVLPFRRPEPPGPPKAA
jgi:hypothetical protein